MSSLRDHLYGKTKTKQRGTKPILKAHEEKKLPNYVFKMQDLDHPFASIELRLNVVLATHSRSTLGKGRLRRFQSKHPELATRRSQGLEVARAHALCSIILEHCIII